MEGSAFDRWSRLVARSRSRRGVGRAVLASVVGMLGMLPIEDVVAHDPRSGCRKLSDPKKRRACLRRASAHNRNQHPCPTPEHIEYGAVCFLRSELGQICRAWVAYGLLCPQCGPSSFPSAYCQWCPQQAAAYGWCCDAVIAGQVRLSVPQLQSRVLSCVCTATPAICATP